MITAPDGVSANIKHLFQDMHQFRRAEAAETSEVFPSGFDTIADIVDLSPEALAVLDILTKR